MIKHENEKFSSCICKHVFDRIKIEIIDNKNDEEYQLDMPPEIYEELKKLIIEFEKSLTSKINRVY